MKSYKKLDNYYTFVATVGSVSLETVKNILKIKESKLKLIKNAIDN